jgi:hypothetical protein
MPPRRGQRTRLDFRKACLTEPRARSLADRRMVQRLGMWLFAVTSVVFMLSPVWVLGDSNYSMLLSENIIRKHSSYLNTYEFPEPIQKIERCVSPSRRLRSAFLTYQLDRVHGNVVYCYPNGSSILSIPFVVLMNLLGVHCHDPDGRCLPLGEGLIQRLLAALLMAGFTVIVFHTATQVLAVGPSLTVAVATAFGTQVWSTASRVMESHTWLIFLGGLAAYYMLGRETGRVRRSHPIALATLISWMYLVRPTGAIPVLCVTIYVFAFWRSDFIAYSLTGLAWFAGFVCYSWFTFGKLIPDYYLDSRIDFGNLKNLPAIFFSPSRGLFVFVPAFAFVLYVLVRYGVSLRYRRLAVLALSMVILQILIVALWPTWWGGYSYGPRLMADALPWIVLLAILGLAARVTDAGQVLLGRTETTIAFVLIVISIVINGRGAWSHATSDWNAAFDIDSHPERLKDWSNPQFMAGLIPLPDRSRP